MIQDFIPVIPADPASHHLIHLWAHTNNVEQVRWFIENSGNLDLEDARGRTALEYALTAGNTEIVRLFLEHGARHPPLKSMLFYAVEKNYTGIIDLILAHEIKTGVNLSDQELRKNLRQKKTSQKVMPPGDDKKEEISKRLLEDIFFKQGPDQNTEKMLDRVLQTYQDGISWLFRRAVQENDYQKIIRFGQDPRLRYGSPHVLAACQILRKKERPPFLMRAKDNADLINRAVMLSSFNSGRVDMVIIRPDLVPLCIEMLAAVCDNKDYKDFVRKVVKALRRLQDDPLNLGEVNDRDLIRVMRCTDRLGGVFERRLMDLLDLALSSGHPLQRVLRIIPPGETRFRGARNDTPLHLATRYMRLDVVNALLGMGADATLVNDDRETPLHLALIRNQNTHLIAALFKNMGVGKILRIALESVLVSENETYIVKIIELLIKDFSKRQERRKKIIWEDLKVQQMERQEQAKLFWESIKKEDLDELIDSALQKADQLKHVFLLYYAITGKKNKVSALIGRGAKAEPVGSDSMRYFMKKEMEAHRQKMEAQRQIDLYKDDDLYELERDVAAQLGIYDYAVLGIGAEPTIRAEHPPEQLSAKKIPRTYRIVAVPPQIRQFIDPIGVTVPIEDQDRVPPELLEQYRKRTSWHRIVSSARDEMIRGTRTIADYKDFLEDIRDNFQTIRDARPEEKSGLIPLRWTDDASLVARRTGLFTELEALVKKLYVQFQSKTTVFAVDTINVLRGRDKELRATDYTDPEFQAVFDAAFARHAGDIASVLRESGIKTTIVWVCPRLEQADNFVVRHTVSEGQHREAIVTFAVRADDLRFTRGLDDFFLLSLITLYEASDDKKTLATRLIVVSGDKFRDWNVDATGYDVAWAMGGDQRIQERAKKMAS